LFSDVITLKLWSYRPSTYITRQQQLANYRCLYRRIEFSLFDSYENLHEVRDSLNADLSSPYTVHIPAV